MLRIPPQVRLRASRPGGVEPSYLLRVATLAAYAHSARTRASRDRANAATHLRGDVLRCRRDEWRHALAEAVDKARAAPRPAPTVRTEHGQYTGQWRDGRQVRPADLRPLAL